MGRDRYARQSLGALHSKIKKSRALLIGAGGIGCELLKNLVLTGFGEIHVVDLDTIDLSNLNRQFLFRHEHIKQAKATVAIEVASAFNPACQLTAHCANIKDTQHFPLSFFRSFTIVFNALDNLDARRHVNKMCLVADVPLIESGTTGFNGQVQAIKRGKTACYDCTEKIVPKTYPVCTIRSTPSQPIHSIVWAKSYLLPELFGVSEDEENPDPLDHTEDAGNAQEIKNLKAEVEALKKLRGIMGKAGFAQQVFDKVFKHDIDRLRGMADMWKHRPPPNSLDFSTLQAQIASSPDSPVSLSDQRPWTLLDNFSIFTSSLQRLGNRAQKDMAAGAAAAEMPDPSKIRPAVVFDKDDVDTLDFVTSASNLRSYIFSIPLQSRFTVKQMAGNIIPAIATTNAMTAGLCVMQGFKILRGDFLRAKMLFLETSGARALNSEPPRPPNPDCAVCSVAMASVDMDPNRATLRDLVDGVLKGELGYGEELTIMNDVGPIYDPEMEDMLPKKFVEMGVQDDSFLTVIDDDEHQPRINLQLAVTNRTIEEGRPVVLVAPYNRELDLTTVDDEDDKKEKRAAKIEIARKPKRSTLAETSNEVGVAPVTNGTGKSAKRSAQEADLDDPDTLGHKSGFDGNLLDAGGTSTANPRLLSKVSSDEIDNDNDPFGFEPNQAIFLSGDHSLNANTNGTGGDDGSIVIDD